MNQKQSKAKARRTFPREFKEEAVRMVTEGGHPLPQVARDLELNPRLIRRWREELKQEGSQAFPGKGHQKPEEEELRRLHREIARLQEERDILKKALAIFSGPRRP